MNNDHQHPAGCSDEFAELCALSTSGELTLGELDKLKKHLSACQSCAALLRDYMSLAQVGMPKLAAEFEPEELAPKRYSGKKVERRLITALHRCQHTEQPDVHPTTHRLALSGYWKHNWRLTPAIAVGTALVLLLLIAAAFELGRRTGAESPSAVRMAAPLPASISPLPNAPDPDNAKLQEKLVVAQKLVDKMTAQSAEADRRVTELTALRASLVAQIDGLNAKGQATSQSLVAVTEQRDALQQQLDEASKSLAQVKQDLSRAEQDRQGSLLRVTSLETEIHELHEEVSKANSAATNSEAFLAEDRDIRELMGARQLYIADVFDVQHDGQRSKPFGRVFYTKGKSLIFYAFDLQSQPEYREAKTFQAWGKADSASAKPVNLGIFYLDSEKNRRWVLKTDNPDLLAQINAVFVTVEPHGGSQKPTGKPFLEAYLHSVSPNHP